MACAPNWVKVQLMQDTSEESTLEAKNAFEQDCMTRGVASKQYHANNGRYAENTFKDDCKAKLQSLIFCGVWVYWQNGIAESKIKHLSLARRTMLLYAKRHWPEYITTMLWPFGLLAAVDCMNNLHIDM